MKKYSLLQKFFHNIVLKNDQLLNITFDIEKFFALKKNKINNSKKLFITGYARSGTTILLNSLFKTGVFKSLTYKDMPLVLSPKLNRLFSFFKTNNTKIARAHGDQIEIDIESPEAFEEIFWKNRLKNQYIKTSHLEENDVSDNLLDEFSKFVNLINTENKIYLSKNNNNILRIKKIKNLPNSLFLILYRKPEYQARSLHIQHENFFNLQKKDKFVLEYMNSIGHYEFGKNHKVFFNKNIYNNNLNDVNYWLYQWIKVYRYLLDLKKKNNDLKNVSFLSYEELTKNTDSFNRGLNNFLKKKIFINKIDNKNNQNKIKNLSFNKDLRDEANIIYDEMEKYSFF